MDDDAESDWPTSALPFFALFTYIILTVIADAFFKLSGVIELLLLLVALVVIFAGPALRSLLWSMSSRLFDSKSRKSTAELQQQQNAALRIQLSTVRKHGRDKGAKVSQLLQTNERLLGEVAALKGARDKRETDTGGDIDSNEEEESGEEDAEEPLHPLLAALAPRRLTSRMREYCAGAIVGADQRARADDLLDRAMRRSGMSCTWPLAVLVHLRLPLSRCESPICPYSRLRLAPFVPSNPSPFLSSPLARLRLLALPHVSLRSCCCCCCCCCCYQANGSGYDG